MGRKIVVLMQDIVTSVIFGTLMYVIGDILVEKFKDHKPTKGD